MKHITNLVLASLFLSHVSAADIIRFEKGMTWKQVKAKALKEKKMIFFDAYTTWCGPCKYLENSVYTDPAVSVFFNANYINVKFDMESGEGIGLAEEFSVTAYPTLLFFSPEGKLVHKYVGALDPSAFLGLGKDAKEPSKQYYTLKEKITKGLLDDAGFRTWAELAADLEDDDAEEILADYYARKSDILANKDIAQTALLYTPKLSDAQLQYLYAHVARIRELMEWDEQTAGDKLYALLFRKAASAYDRNSRNKDSFFAVIRKFNAPKESFARKDLEVRIALFVNRDPAEAAALLVRYLDAGEKEVSLGTIGQWVFDYASRFKAEQFSLLLEKLSGFTLRGIDKGQEYWPDLLKMLCYEQTGDEANAKVYAAKTLKFPGLPGKYRDLIKEWYKISK